MVKQVDRGNTITLSKLDAAEAHIKAAVKMYLENGHLAPVFHLANAAREIVATLGNKSGVTTLHDDLTRQGMLDDEQIKNVRRVAGFLKHADRDHNSVVELNDQAVAGVLQLAGHDFDRVKGETPVEVKFLRHGFAQLIFPKFAKRPCAHNVP
jgi:hypothetical protein